MGVVDVLCYRDYTRDGKRVNSHSVYVKGIKLTGIKTAGSECECVVCVDVPPVMCVNVVCIDVPRVMGWERNDKNKLAPRMVNLSASMDPVR